MKRESLALVLGLVLLSVQAFAGTKTWTDGTSDHQWQTGGNWSPAGIPGASSNDVYITDAAPANSTQAVLAASISLNTLTFDKSTDFTLAGGGEGGYRIVGSCIVTAKQAQVYVLPELNFISSDKIFDVAGGGKVVMTPGWATDSSLGQGTVLQKGRGTVWVRNHYGTAIHWKFGTGADGGGTLAYTMAHAPTVAMEGYGNVSVWGYSPGNGERLYLWPLSGYTGVVTTIGADNGMAGILFTNDSNVLKDFNITLDDTAGAANPPSIIEAIRYGNSRDWAWTNVTLSGAGRVIISDTAGGEYWWRSTNKKLTLSGCKVAPGGVGRVMNLYADVDFQANGTTPTTLSIAISNNVCDKVAVLMCHTDASVTPGPVSSGISPNRLANCALDLTVTKGDYTGRTFTNLTTSSDLSGGAHFFGSVSLHGAKATINYLNGKVTLTGVEAPKPAGTVVLLR